MKRLTWFLLALTLANPVFSEKYCPTDYIESEKNIVTVYKKLRKIKSDCKTRQADYLSFCKRAFLSKKYSIAIWACRKGIKNAEKNSNEDITAELIYFLVI
ncbi:MAG: hypothetical protein OEV66_03795 [Spirochaetia bacterium]|nr:hypothetical protein [Spirochaetia bacterium]